MSDLPAAAPSDSFPDQATDARLLLLRSWLAPLAAKYRLTLESLRSASDDASFRRYFRVDCEAGQPASLIAMDAPPPMEDCRPFVHVAGLLRDAGVNTPRIHEADLEQGFLLLDDLGTTTYLSRLDDEHAPALYSDAWTALVRMQSASRAGQLPTYDRALLLRELQLFPDWYLTRHRGIELDDAQRSTLNSAFEALLANNLAQPQVYVHRDYHSRNLMVVAEGNPGVIDFQDAVYGPITYDLVSLLRDAYRCWDEQQVLDWTIRYWQAARAAGLPVDPDFGQFYRDFEWMGLQRHLKVLGIFARLNHRDGKPRYLADLPLVRDYVVKTLARYREFTGLLHLFETLDPDPTAQFSSGYTF